MARNEEKAMNLFNKWQTFKTEYHSKGANLRPLVAAECESVNDAEKFRRDIVRDLIKKTALINNATLGEFKIRDINDEINKLLKQKHFWEARIRELGGGDLVKQRSKQLFDVEGKELPGQPGYKYFGAAKDLPGVRELFAEELNETEARRKRKTLGDLFKNITPDYYGYRDDDDGVLVIKEAEIEKIKVQESLQMFEKKRREELSIGTNNNNATNTNTTQLAAQVWREDRLQEEKRHVAEEIEFDSFLQDHLAKTIMIDTMTNNSANSNNNNNYNAQVNSTSDSSVNGSNVDEENELLLEQRKQSLLDMLF